MLKEFPKKYNASIVEKKWQYHWVDRKVYNWNPDAKREDSFVIDTPPPTVSGLLHMGHVFSYTQTDFIARYQRMKGKNVFYPMGFDDNGLPTERLVEKVKKIKGSHLEKSEFVNICKDVVVESEKDFRSLFDSIALSVDWNQHYCTISDESTHIAQLSFIDLYNKGYIYRKMQPTLWDVVDQTALAQADIVDQDMASKMSDIKFDLEGGEDSILIATTRPELLPACVAIFIHPDDVRAKNLVGKFAITPLFKIKVPIIADDKVDLEKGTGLVMCCTFGDQTDIFWWQKHQLELKVILNKAGCISGLEESLKDTTAKNEELSNIIEQLEGKKVKQARDTMLLLLENHGLLISSRNIMHSVKCAERSMSPLEILVTPQWFVSILEYKSQLLEQAQKINWYPQAMKLRIEQWIQGLSWDWCISRQRFFGVSFPVWYSKRKGEEGKILMADINSLPIDPNKSLPDGYTKEEVVAEQDIMDTWATSSITPQLNARAISKDSKINQDRYSKLFPADLRPQAHEIIRTWAFYTIAKSFFHSNDIPWKNIMISGWCLASDKTKMSKSKGNVVTPEKLIIEKSADIVRFWTSTSYLGADTAYSEPLLSNGKKLINKLWNASKFVAIQLNNWGVEDQSLVKNHEYIADLLQKNIITEKLDLWALSKLSLVIEQSTKFFEEFEYAKAREIIERFFWDDFCDYYLEYVKTRSYANKTYLLELYGAEWFKELEISDERLLELKTSVHHSLYYILNAILRLFAPIIPHITEEIYDLMYSKQYINFEQQSIHSQGMGVQFYNIEKREDHLELGDFIQRLVMSVRKYRAEQEISLKKIIQEATITVKNQVNEQRIKQVYFDLCNTLNIANLKVEVNSDLSEEFILNYIIN